MHNNNAECFIVSIILEIKLELDSRDETECTGAMMANKDKC